MKLEPRHWYMLGLLAFFIIIATLIAYDVGGVFSSPGLMQE